MLASVVAYLSILLILCALDLLISWVYQNVGHPAEAVGSRRSESEIAISHGLRRPPVRPLPSKYRKVWLSQPEPPRLWRSSRSLTWHVHLQRPDRWR
jgi:hypothetical protein